MFLEKFAENLLHYGLLTCLISVTIFLIKSEIKRIRKKHFKKKLKLYKVVSIDDIDDKNDKTLSHHLIINKKLSVDPAKKFEVKVNTQIEEKKPLKKVKINIVNDAKVYASDSINKNETPDRAFRR